MRHIKLPLAGILLASAAVPALADCNGQFGANKFCGSISGGLPGPVLIPPGGTTPIAGGTVVGNPTAGSALPVATSSPLLGIPGSTIGSLSFANTTSGTVTLKTVGGALGTSILSLPAITDTVAGLALANGGTNNSLAASNGGIVWTDASKMQILAGTATARQMLQSGTSATPAWSSATWPATTIINQILYSNSTNTVTGLGTTNGGILNANGTGVPAMTITPLVGVAGSSVGEYCMANATSGSICLAPATGALGTSVATVPIGSFTFAGLSLNQTFTGQFIETGTSAPSSAAGQTVVAGTIAPPSLTNNGQSWIYNTVAGGLFIQGQGSAQDLNLANKSGTSICSITTGATTFTCFTLALINPLAISSGGTGAANQTAAITALMPTATRTGDVSYWNGSIWTTLAGNNSGTQFFSENASGVPAWSAGSGVTSATIAGTAGDIAVSGTCTITSTGTCTVDLASARKTLPTIQTFTSGTGTYTTPANALWIEIRMVGGGGGGQGSGTTPGAASGGGNTCWNTSGAACSSPVLEAAAGSAASGFNTSAAGGSAAGSTTCNVEQQSGSSGGQGSNVTNTTGGSGGNSPFYAGGGTGGSKAPQNGGPAATNSGGGGGGGGATTTAGSGGGGGSGGFCWHIINNPAGSYTYAVGTSGGGGTAGTSGAAGGNGAAGKIVVTEHYN